jgi:magnesium chelatase subunit I
MSVANYENMVANSYRRAIRLGEKQAAPRISDLSAIQSSTQGKIELETLGEVSDAAVLDRLISGSIASVFNRSFAIRQFDRLVQAFENGLEVEISDMMPAMDYVHQLSHLDGIREGVDELNVGGNPAAVASAVEFILEGLHLNRRLNKNHHDGPARYSR